jgi:hypothetical protein
MSIKAIEEQRAEWAKVAKKYGWYTEPFYIQVWLHDDGTVQDSVSFKGIDKDYILDHVEEEVSDEY